MENPCLPKTYAEKDELENEIQSEPYTKKGQKSFMPSNLNLLQIILERALIYSHW